MDSFSSFQVDGIKFMYDSCYGSVDNLEKYPGSGCVLAHCMGLGKTLQVGPASLNFFSVCLKLQSTPFTAHLSAAHGHHLSPAENEEGACDLPQEYGHELERGNRTMVEAGKIWWQFKTVLFPRQFVSACDVHLQ